MKKSSAVNGAAKKAVKPKKASSTNHQLAQKFPAGILLTDLTKCEWQLGPPIGSGGFGLLYLADKKSKSSVTESADYVIKVEPHSNGPLFCELHFYQRAAKPETIREWMSSRRMKSLGVPKFIATGNIDYNGTKYRFLVMERFGTDLQKLFENGGKRFPTHTVFKLGIKVLDALEYIHSQHYVHADIKASNLLTGYSDQQQVYLVDYGLAFRFLIDGKHKEYREDPKRAHDGTVEFTSRDAHRGVAPSRRGDLEILGYCLVQWLCGRLPWEDNLSDKNHVRDEKIRYMSNIPMFMKKCFADAAHIPVGPLSAYLQYVANLEYTDTPDYKYCRELFSQALAAVGHKEADRLDFQIASEQIVSPKTGRKRPLPSPRTMKPIKLQPAASSKMECEPSPRRAGKVSSTVLEGSPSTPKVSGRVVAPAVRKSPISTGKKVASAVKKKMETKSPRGSQVAISTTEGPIGRKVKRRRIANVVTTATQTSPGFLHRNAFSTTSVD